MTFELTEEERKNLMDLLDFAVKSGGLNVAAIALPLAHIFNAPPEKVEE